MKEVNPNVLITPRNDVVLICSECGVDERGDPHWNPKHWEQKEKMDNIYKVFCPKCLEKKGKYAVAGLPCHLRISPLFLM